MRFLPMGTDGLLVEVEDTPTAMGVYAEARRRGVRAVDIVPAARTVLFTGVPDRSALEAEVGGWTIDPDREVGPAAGERRVVEVPTVYDGEDLAAVARLWDMTSREVVAVHTSCDMVVAFSGFAPGFAYCTGLPVTRPVPRLPTPRTRVPTGAVGLAGEFTGVYPTASPGGWRLIGRTALSLWDSSREHPAVLAPGTPVRFVEVAP